jgi:hypothetical protein
VNDLDLAFPVKIDLGLVPGDRVVVLAGNDDGAVKRGRRRWHPGRTVGVVIKKHVLHTRGWWVAVDDLEVILFEDELAWPSVPSEGALAA